MRTIMAKTPHDSSLSFSRRYLHWTTKNKTSSPADDDDDNDEVVLNSLGGRQRKGSSAVSRLLSIFGGGGGERRVVGTLFGHRRGHVHLAFQEGPTRSPAVLIELAVPTSSLVREMASGLVRIALECDRRSSSPAPPLIDEPVWRTYCNGRKCGSASRAECGPDEWKVLRAVGPITMGAGVLPGCGGGGGGGGEGEVMFMRARFERVVGSKDSEAFYLMSPDGSSGPELSMYLLRV